MKNVLSSLHPNQPLAFDMSNFNNNDFGQFNDGIGEGDGQDDESPLFWRTGPGVQAQQESHNQYPNSEERLNFPLGNDQPALEYALSLNALNVAFSGCIQPPASAGYASAADCQNTSTSSQTFDYASDAAVFTASSRQQGALDYQWQQSAASTGLPIDKLPLEHSQSESALSIPQRRTSEMSTASHDSQGRVQGMFGSKKAKTLLPVDFKPSKNSVILGRGRCSESEGNSRLKLVVQEHLQEYLEAQGKLEKTFIVSKVLSTIEESCPVGAFVKYENGRWWSAGERASREKIGASFRDALNTHSKSNPKSTLAKRKAKGEAEKKKAPK